LAFPKEVFGQTLSMLPWPSRHRR